MSPIEIAALAVAAGMIGGMVLYLRPVIRQSREKAPVLATWVLFSVATSLSLWMYLRSENHSVVANVGNIVDPLMCWAAAFVLAYYSWQRHRRLVFDFDAVQIGCFIAAGLAVIYWFLTDNEVHANLTVQAIISIGYVPTLRKLHRALRNTESIEVWVVFLITSALSFVPAYAHRDFLATVYAVRAVTCVLVLFAFIVRAELRGRRERT